MSTLTDEIKTFIVTGLACFDTPSEVVEAVKANFDIEISRQHVYSYDPRCSQRPAQRWRDLHAATRAAFLKDRAEIGIAQKSARLRLLDRMTHRALARNYIGLAASLLEQAAKECGGYYDGRRSVRIKPTAPAPSGPESPAALDPAATGTCGRLA
jgi:hypothetical protein